MEVILSQVVGWIGTALIVFAYGAVSYKKLSAGSVAYQLLNLFGAIGVGINAFYAQAWPSFTLQIVWAMIAIVALARL